MPVVMREGGWRFIVYVDDHAPPHVHAWRDGYVKIHLAGPDGLPEVVKLARVTDHAAWRALAIAHEHQQRLLRHWRSIHG